MRFRNWMLRSDTTATPSTDVGLVVLRVVAMLLLIFLHGLGKVPPQAEFVGWIGSMGFPAPALFAWLSAFAEVGIALLILVGLFARPAALFLFVYFAIVVLVAHSGDALADRELPIMFMTIGLTLGLTGPGRYSLDAMFRNGSSRTETL